MARPTQYTEELGKAICLEISTTSKGLKTVCDANKAFPAYKTVFNWLADPEKAEFLHLYTIAREAQADVLADEIIEISDDSSRDSMDMRVGKEVVQVENREWTNRSRLRVDARKWVAAKLKPRKYGEKLDVTTNGNSILPAPQWLNPDENNATGK